MGREGKKTAGCVVSLLLLGLALAYTTRLWFDELEVNLTLAVHAGGYHPAEFRVETTVFTPLIGSSRTAFYRAEGTVIDGDGISEGESLNLNALLAKNPPKNPTALGETVPEGTMFKVLFNDGLPHRRSTYESPRVIPFRNDFVRSIRLQLFVTVLKTFWPPALWALGMFLFVRHQTARWKKQQGGLR